MFFYFQQTHCQGVRPLFLTVFWVRIKKTRILVRSVRSEAFRTIQYLIPVGSETVRMVRKLQNCMQIVERVKKPRLTEEASKQKAWREAQML